MKLLISVLVLTSSVILAGCQSTEGRRQSQSDNDANRQKFATADNVASDCAKASLSTPSGQVVSEQIIFLSRDNPNYAQLMSSRTRLTTPQKIALREYLAANLKCRDAFFKGLEDTPYYGVFAQYFNTMDDIYVKVVDRPDYDR